MVRIDPPTRPCSICGNPVTENRHRPFCSKRCAEIDLGRWLKGIYHVPTNEPVEGSNKTEDSEE